MANDTSLEGSYAPLLESAKMLTWLCSVSQELYLLGYVLCFKNYAYLVMFCVLRIMLIWLCSVS